MATPDLDCQRCGACCCNSAENRAEGFRDYVEITRRDALFRDAEARARWAVDNADGVPHLRLVGGDQRCAALEGRLGVRVKCAIYDLRPAGCRRVNAGTAECFAARQSRGIDRSKR